MTTPNETYCELLEFIGPVKFRVTTDPPHVWAVTLHRSTEHSSSCEWWLECESFRGRYAYRSDDEAHSIIEKAWRKWLRENDPDVEWIVSPDGDWWILYRWDPDDIDPVQIVSTKTEPEAMLAAVKQVLKEKRDETGD